MNEYELSAEQKTWTKEQWMMYAAGLEKRNQDQYDLAWKDAFKAAVKTVRDTVRAEPDGKLKTFGRFIASAIQERGRP